MNQFVNLAVWDSGCQAEMTSLLTACGAATGQAFMHPMDEDD